MLINALKHDFSLSTDVIWHNSNGRQRRLEEVYIARK
jgi:hypothetical protein